MSKTAVCIFSGGLDSSVLLHYLLKMKYSVYTLTFRYGQRHSNEVDYAKKHIEFLKSKGFSVSHKIVDLNGIKDLISVGALTGKEEVPHDFYTVDTQKQTIVPNRNMIFLAVAGGYAKTIGADVVCYAAHSSDYVVYPDCRRSFVSALSSALCEATEGITIFAPFLDFLKKDVVGIGLKLGVPFELTWSCYEGKFRPCLSCGTCLERTEAFLLNNTQDPLLTNTEWKKAVEIYKEKRRNKDV